MNVNSPPKLETRLLRCPALTSRRFTLLLVGLGCLVILMIVVFALLAPWWTRSSGEHLTVAEAVQRGIRLQLPEAASDIRFYQHLQPDQVVVVDFAITEAAFLEWAARQGWQPEPIVGSITIWPRSCFGDRGTMIEVMDGYAYSTLERGVPNTFSVEYDRRTQRAYYQFSSEPHTGEGG